MSVVSRIGSALAANAFGQAVTVGSQLLLTPLFFKFWGAAKYGEWLILSSIPAYLTMADLGIGSAAGNEMTMRAAAGDRVGAQQTFLGALWVSFAAAALVCLAGAGAAALSYGWRMPDTPTISREQAAWVLLGLALTVALGLTGGVVSAGFRCCERNALGIFLANVSRLLEALATGGLLLAGQGPAAVCGGLVLIKALLLVVQLVLLRQVCPWLFTAGVRADHHVARRLLAPALGFLAFPLGNALALQGPILIIGAVYGGAAVAMFSALRTLARVPMQITNMINSSVWPEMSRAYGGRDLPLLRKLHQVTLGSTTQVITVTGVALVLAGPWITRLWLGAEAPFQIWVFAALVLLTILAATWGASAVVLAAINAHVRVGVGLVLVTGLCIAVAAALARAWGWPGLLGPLLLAEVTMLVWVLGQVLRISEDSYRNFAGHAVMEPWRRLQRIRLGH